MKTELILASLILTSAPAAYSAELGTLSGQQLKTQDLDEETLNAISQLFEKQVLKPNSDKTDIIIDRKVLEELVNRGMIQNIDKATGGWTPGAEK